MSVNRDDQAGAKTGHVRYAAEGLVATQQKPALERRSPDLSLDRDSEAPRPSSALALHLNAPST